ncbi:hypothetical protein LEP1GSC193_2970 [Leptospira alstonii serovar Pingchang str. 80-412]|uniref:Uncharacterized protein n=2 Tax=Leptospira alstonii TaxID=28452 RepID=M6CP83_9LEPT|nr:hypothetical protein LEP1GSC194_1227 [Leptospira alstonii serovar Sichuan str. 79601]EQA81658.1 hypothetical protein LEP1GSC193_2970 [Leptospira alstonii serovar Pingchang str. 80-412]
MYLDEKENPFRLRSLDRKLKKRVSVFILGNGKIYKEDPWVLSLNFG